MLLHKHLKKSAAVVFQPLKDDGLGAVFPAAVLSAARLLGLWLTTALESDIKKVRE
ncbi:hypothetical protein [Oscillibacter sp.]|uniref:hypothetical protein n=1 Tax=Oscillibacter sp. TaxID=1945593 RepID=UPI0028A148BB|nr:hypothetical protein [Oscillibacter sp.]